MRPRNHGDRSRKTDREAIEDTRFKKTCSAIPTPQGLTLKLNGERAVIID